MASFASTEAAWTNFQHAIFLYWGLSLDEKMVLPSQLKTGSDPWVEIFSFVSGTIKYQGRVPD